MYSWLFLINHFVSFSSKDISVAFCFLYFPSPPLSNANPKRYIQVILFVSGHRCGNSQSHTGRLMFDQSNRRFFCQNCDVGEEQRSGRNFNQYTYECHFLILVAQSFAFKVLEVELRAYAEARYFFCGCKVLFYLMRAPVRAGLPLL